MPWKKLWKKQLAATEKWLLPDKEDQDKINLNYFPPKSRSRLKLNFSKATYRTYPSFLNVTCHMTFPESWAINALKPASTLAQITYSLRLDGDQFGWLSLINATITWGVALKTLAFAFDTSSSLVTVVRANLADDIYVRHESTFLVLLVVLGIHKSGSLTNVLETR